MKKTTDGIRAKKVERAIRLAWDSLQSHLPHTYGGCYGGDHKHHKQSVREYAELIKLLSELY